jgi:ATP-dependent exoDNAse (exonuclease V) beta subunit
MGNNFQIYNASAGSGKTYTLVLKYLSIALQTHIADNSLFNPTTFSRILAITFTNKVTAEMKIRILKELKALKDNEPKSMAESLISNSVIDKTELIKRANLVYNQMLHQYSRLSVSTIDSFNYRLLKGFSVEAELGNDFTVNLNPIEFYQRVFKRMLAALESDTELLKSVEFLFDESDSEESREAFEKKLFELLNKINAEDLRFFMSAITEEDVQIINNTIKLSSLALDEVTEHVLNECDKIEKFFEKNGYSTQDTKAGSLAKLINKLRAGEPYWILENPKRFDLVSYIGKKDKFADENSDVIQRFLDEVADMVPVLVQQKIFKVLRENRFKMVLYQKVSALVEQVKTEDRFVDLSAFNHIISDLMADENPDFIYEKIGERYQHILIDEFQDTSVLQWVNLFPLVINALATGGLVLLVGDPKQAIYRFRNGRVEQMVGLIAEEGNPNIFHFDANYKNIDAQQVFASTLKVNKLDTNYRSAKEVVDFNNEIINQFLNIPALEPYYRGGQQKVFKQNLKGNVSIFQAEEIGQKSLSPHHFSNAIEQVINSAIKRGYNYNDITFLSYGNKHQVEFAQVIKEKFPKVGFSGSDAGRVKDNIPLNLLVALLRFNLYKQANDALLGANYLAALCQIPEDEWPNFVAPFMSISEDKKNSKIDLPALVKSKFPDFDAEKYFEKPLEQYFGESWNAFGLSKVQPEYLFFILDFCEQIRASQGRLNAANFMEAWNLLEKESVNLPENPNAINGTTFHKSKGLEYPIVICFLEDREPGARFGEEVWCENKNNEKPIFDKLPTDFKLPLNSKLVKEKCLFNKDLINAETQNLVETANKLYVAFTRAERELYILYKKPKSINVEGGATGKLFSAIIDRLPQGIFQEVVPDASNKQLFKLDDKEEAQQNKIVTIGASRNFNNLFRGVKVSGEPKAGRLSLINVKYNPEKESVFTRLKGNELHEFLADFKDESDLPDLQLKLKESSFFDSEEVALFCQNIKNGLQSELLKKWFNPKNKHFSERTLLIPASKIQQRPDRVVVNENGEALLLDFKTGEPFESYKKDIENYGISLEKAGFKVVEKCIWYLKTGEIQIV